MAAPKGRLEARSWRCLACGQVYTDVGISGQRQYHTCPLVEDPTTKREVQRPGHRDENLVQDTPGGPVRIRAAGAGRDLIAYGDVVTGRPAHELASIATWPAIEQSPHPEDPVDEREHRPMPGQAE